MWAILYLAAMAWALRSDLIMRSARCRTHREPLPIEQMANEIVDTLRNLHFVKRATHKPSRALEFDALRHLDGCRNLLGLRRCFCKGDVQL
jgi:hypothetical protein